MSEERDGFVWLSICSAHRQTDDDCSLCRSGYWASKDELATSAALFRDDYAEWYRQHNNGDEPTESAWATWRLLTAHDPPVSAPSVPVPSDLDQEPG